MGRGVGVGVGRGGPEEAGVELCGGPEEAGVELCDTLAASPGLL